MSLISSQFIALTAACSLLYFLFPLKLRWIVLLAASMVFYQLNSGKVLAVLLGTSLVTYGIGLWIGTVYEKGKQKAAAAPDLTKEERKALSNSTKRKARLILTLGIAIDLGALLYLKYSDFFLRNASLIIPGVRYQPLNLLRPLGISFYTLQALSYLFDVYRKKYPADRNPLKFLLYMSWFPQIVQGPIARFDRLADRLFTGHPFSYAQFTNGLQLML